MSVNKTTKWALSSKATPEIIMEMAFAAGRSQDKYTTSYTDRDARSRYFLYSTNNEKFADYMHSKYIEKVIYFDRVKVCTTMHFDGPMRHYICGAIPLPEVFCNGESLQKVANYKVISFLSEFDIFVQFTEIYSLRNEIQISHYKDAQQIN